MSLTELEKSGKIKKIPVDKIQIQNLIAVSDRDLKVAKTLLQTNFDWCFIASYNCALQISRAFMFSYGYTADSEGHHKNVVDFVSAIIGEDEKITSFDLMRRKRHNIVYDETGAISENEAKNYLNFVEDYFSLLKRKITERLLKVRQ